MKKHLHWFIISTFVSLYLVVSIISTIHVIDFFKLSNPDWLAIFLAISFEIGAAASLASLIVLEKMNKTLVWVLFLLLTAMQAMGNTYYAFINLENFEAWSQLFGLEEEELIFQKRILSLISGAILPLVALGFIKSLVDYLKPSEKNSYVTKTDDLNSDGKTSETSKRDENISMKDPGQVEMIIDGGGILVNSVEDSELISSENPTAEEIAENLNPSLIEQESEIEQLDKNQNSENNSNIENANTNRPKLSDRPSPQVDPTLL
jgi:hypothetical protein